MSEKNNNQLELENKESPKKQAPLNLIFGATIALCATTVVCIILAVIFLVLWLGAKDNAPADQNGNNSSDVGNNDSQTDEETEEKKDEISVNADGYVVVNGVKTEHKIHTTDEISVNADGYVVVNGVTTEILADKDDVITVDADGYVVVNGVKTEHKIHTTDEISVNADGYVVVNGVTTEILADKDDVITVDADGYVVVNGVKTEHKIHTTDEISVNADGYVVVNGVTTEIFANKDDVITVDADGYVVVNGVKTEYEIKNKNHSFGDWKLYNENETDCEKKLYYRTCPDCSTIEWKEGKYEDHNFKTVTTKPTCQAGGFDTKTCKTCGKVEICNNTSAVAHSYVDDKYIIDVSYHWKECNVCNTITNKEEHTLDDGICTVCDNPIVGTTDGIIYRISEDGTYAEVVEYYGTATKIIIASEYEGVQVKKISDYAFKNREITSVIIPDSVTSIGEDAFRGCKNLTSVVLPNNLKSIGRYAFAYCYNIPSISIPDSIENIEVHAFISSGIKKVFITDLEKWCNISFEKYGYSNPLSNGANLYLNGEIVTELIIPDSITNIGDFTFYGCTSITSAVMHNNVTSIGKEAFRDCENLTSVTLSDNLISIGNQAFYNCKKITSVIIPESLTGFGYDVFNSDHITYNEYKECKYLGTKDNPYFILKEATNIKAVSYEIHPDTVIIAGKAFYNFYYLQSIELPEKVVSIGNVAFYQCSSLTSIIMNDKVLNIGIEAFNECNRLNDVYYTGSEEDWNAISIGIYNYDFKSANRHYNYIPEE